MLRCQVSSSYIDKVDGFIRQGPLRDVLHGGIYGCFQNSIRQFDVVVSFVEWANPHENFESIFCRWSINLNFVKTTSQSCVFHDSIPIFILGRSTDNGQFATRQSWFQNISQALRPLSITCRTSPQDLVNFIEEEDDVTSRFNFFDEVLDIFFEGPTVLSARFQTRNIDGDNFFILNSCWYITINDSLC